MHPVESQRVLLTSAPSDQFLNLHSTFHAGIKNSLYHSLQTWAASGPESLSDPWKLGYLGTSKIKRKICTVQREAVLGLLDVLTLSRFLSL